MGGIGIAFQADGPREIWMSNDNRGLIQRGGLSVLLLYQHKTFCTKNKHGYFTVVFLYLLAAISSFKAWAEDPHTVDDIVVSASRIPTSGPHSPANSTVVFPGEIRHAQAVDALELLRYIPGLHIDKPGGNGGVSSVYLRGAEANYTQVLLDGVPVNDPTNTRGGSFDLSTIDLLSVARIEVLRGPQSAKYGSDAIAGIINFVSKRGTDQPRYTVFSRIGTGGGDTNSVSARGPINDRGRIATTITHVDAGSSSKEGSYSNSTANVRADWDSTDGGTLGFTFRVSESDAASFPDDSGGSRYSKLRIVDSRDSTEIVTGLRYSSDTSNLPKYSAGLSTYRRRELFDSAGISPGLRNAAGIPANSSETTFDRLELYLTRGFQWQRDFSIVFGTDLRREAGVSNGRLLIGGAPIDNRFVLRRQNFGWFVEGLWEGHPNWTINASARLDNPDAHKSVESFSMGSVYQLVASNTIFKILWGEGFKLPSLYALGNDLVGDPTLQPEEGQTIEFSILQSFRDGASEVRGSLFQSRYRNTIDFDTVLNTLVNRSAIDSRGGELMVSNTFGQQFSLEASVAYAKTSIRGSEEQLKNRARWKSGLNIQWIFSQPITWTASFLRVGEVPASSIPTGDVVLPAYSIVGTSAVWTPTPAWKFSISLENLFGATFDEGVGVSGPDFTTRLAARYGF